MLQRLKRGGWPYSQPPNVPFDPNKDSEQYRGLETWWPTLASAGAGTLRDLSGRGLDADNVAGSPEWVSDATVGVSLKFTRADNDALFTTKTLGFDYDKMTYSLWMYPTQGAGNRMTMLSPNNIAGAVSFETDDATGNEGRLSLVRPGLFVARTGQGVLALNNWHHVLYTKWGVNAGEQAIYIDGISQALAVDAGDNLGSTAAIWRLGERAAASQSFEGFLADVRIYSVAKTPAQGYRMYANPWELPRPRTRRVWAMAPGVARIPRPPAAYNILAIY